MLRLLSSKAQERNDFWKPSKTCHVGTHWIALDKYSPMSTHMSGFQWFFRIVFGDTGTKGCKFRSMKNTRLVNLLFVVGCSVVGSVGCICGVNRMSDTDKATGRRIAKSSRPNCLFGAMLCGESFYAKVVCWTEICPRHVLPSPSSWVLTLAPLPQKATTAHLRDLNLHPFS